MARVPEHGVFRHFLRKYAKRVQPAMKFLPTTNQSGKQPAIFEVRISHCRRPRWQNLGNLSHKHYISLDSFMHSSELVPGAISIAHNGVPIDMSLKIEQNTPLLVVLHGAAPVDVKLPFLSGQSVSKQLNCSKLSISDPSLYLSEELNLSWYAGNIHQPRLLSDIAEIIKKTAQSLDAPRIILLGGSGGGFAAINLAARLPHATAIAMNSQTDILRYHPSHVSKYVEEAWSGNRQLFMSQGVHNLAAALRNSVTKPNVIYLQNENDDFHVKNHLEKFMNELPDFRFELLLEPWEDGHTPPPKELIAATVKRVVETTSADLSSLGFIRQEPAIK